MRDTTALVAANIKKLRKARRWSAERLAELANAIGCPTSRTAIAKREIGLGSAITVDELIAFAAVLSVDPAALLAETKLCLRCNGSPPEGYACLACGDGAEWSAVGPDGATTPPSGGERSDKSKDLDS